MTILNITLNGERLKTSPLISIKDKDVHSQHLTQYNPGSSNQSNQASNETKSIKSGQTLRVLCQMKRDKQ